MGEKRNVGFTIVELVLVIVLLGVLAVSVMPKFFSMPMSSARSNARDAVVSSVQAGLSLYAANQISQGGDESYPTKLDNESAGQMADRAHPLFINVIQDGVMRDWQKKSDLCYTWIGGGAMDDYGYNSTNGTFAYDADGC